MNLGESRPRPARARYCRGPRTCQPPNKHTQRHTSHLRLCISSAPHVPPVTLTAHGSLGVVSAHSHAPRPAHHPGHGASSQSVHQRATPCSGVTRRGRGAGPRAGASRASWSACTRHEWVQRSCVHTCSQTHRLVIDDPLRSGFRPPLLTAPDPTPRSSWAAAGSARHRGPACQRFPGRSSRQPRRR